MLNRRDNIIRFLQAGGTRGLRRSLRPEGKIFHGDRVGRFQAERVALVAQIARRELPVTDWTSLVGEIAGPEVFAVAAILPANFDRFPRAPLEIYLPEYMMLVLAFDWISSRGRKAFFVHGTKNSHNTVPPRQRFRSPPGLRVLFELNYTSPPGDSRRRPGKTRELANKFFCCAGINARV